MSELTMCGYRCDLCKAFVDNIKKKDQREMLSSIWAKYYSGLAIPTEDIYCDGCRCMHQDAKRIDNACPVRMCVIEKRIEHCGICDSYPCDVFLQREGLSCSEAKQKLGKEFDQSEYDEFLLAYDNKTRLDNFKKKYNK